MRKKVTLKCKVVMGRIVLDKWEKLRGRRSFAIRHKAPEFSFTMAKVIWNS